MRLARMKATATGAEHRVAFDIGTDSYRDREGETRCSSPTSGFRLPNWISLDPRKG